MLKKSSLVVLFVSMAVFGTAFSEEYVMYQAPFLSPAQQLAFQPTPERSDESCSATRDSACLNLSGNGSNAPGSISSSTHLTAYLPNVLVTMYVSEIDFEPIGNHHFTTPSAIFWDTYSDEADVQTLQTFTDNIFPANGHVDYSAEYGPNGFPIYQAIVYGACNSLDSFDLEHNASIATGGQNVEYGSFAGVDNNTIDDTGFYNMGYSFLVADGNYDSYAHVNGSVHVTCTAANFLD